MNEAPLRSEPLAKAGRAASRQLPRFEPPRIFGLDRASDAEIFEYARDHGYTIVTKDADFHDLSQRFGTQPKVVWIGAGNSETRRVEELLRERREEILRAFEDPSRRIFRLLP